MVTCRYAENFEKSSRNYRNNHRLFDIRLLRQDYQSYTLKNGFLFFDEFSKFVSATLESGIRSYWTKKVFFESSDTNSYVHNTTDNQRKDFITFQDMLLPIVVIIVGSLLALLMFVLEIAKFYCKSSHFKNFKVTPQLSHTLKSKINLRKWKQKFVRKSSKASRTSDGIVSRKEVEQIIIGIKRETIKQIKFQKEERLIDGYWVSKKFKHGKMNCIEKVSPVVTATTS